MRRGMLNRFLSIVDNRFGIVIFFFLSSIFVEMMFFQLIGFGFFADYFLLNISVLLIISSFILLVPSLKAHLIITSSILLFQVILSYINITMFNVFGTIATIDMIKIINEGVRAVEASFINLQQLVLFILVGCAYLIFNIKIYSLIKDREPKPLRKRFSIALVSVLIVSQVLGFGSYMNQSTSLQTLAKDEEISILDNDGFLFETLIFHAESLRRFGTFSYYFRGIGNTFSYLKGEQRDLLAGSVIEYIQNSEVAPANQYSGISQDNNLIVILAESMEWAAVDEELTPTLFDIKNSNVAMTNFYAQSRTNISETFGFLGSYPLEQSFGNNLPGTPDLMLNKFEHSLPNILKSKGYEGNDFFIFHEKDFYNRINTHKSFGFENIYDVYDFDIKDNNMDFWGDWVLDSEVIKGSIDTIIPDTEEPFFTWMTTMMQHGPYQGNRRLAPHFDYMDSIGWTNPFEGSIIKDEFRHYMATAIDLDWAVEYLMYELEQRGELDETTIVIYSDHHAYYNNLGQMTKDVPPDEFYNPEKYRLPFMIYDNNLPAVEVEEFSSLYDIMPTILDLLGIEYKKNLYMGTSVFDTENIVDLFMSPLGGVFNDRIYTTNGRDIIFSKEDVTDSEIEDFRTQLEEVIIKALMLDNMYVYNVFGDS